MDFVGVNSVILFFQLFTFAMWIFAIYFLVKVLQFMKNKTANDQELIRRLERLIELTEKDRKNPHS